ncbi:hypothetical protein ACFSHP_05200 [Novosphingobium panipatense]
MKRRLARRFHRLGERSCGGIVTRPPSAERAAPCCPERSGSTISGSFKASASAGSLSAGTVAFSAGPQAATHSAPNKARPGNGATSFMRTILLPAPVFFATLQEDGKPATNASPENKASHRGIPGKRTRFIPAHTSEGARKMRAPSPSMR